MQITANGEPFTVADSLSLEAFLAQQGQALGRVVVELNGAALPPSQQKETILQDGDRLEIVRIVAGG